MGPPELHPCWDTTALVLKLLCEVDKLIGEVSQPHSVQKVGDCPQGLGVLIDLALFYWLVRPDMLQLQYQIMKCKPQIVCKTDIGADFCQPFGRGVIHSPTVTTVPLKGWRGASTSTVEDVQRLAGRPRAFQIL
jgi:hypothetical protein